MDDFGVILFLIALLAFGFTGVGIVAADSKFKCSGYNYETNRCDVYTRKAK